MTINLTLDDSVYSIFDVIKDSAFDGFIDLVGGIDNIFIDETYICVESYNTDLIKFLELNKIFYEVNKGELFIYFVHSSYKNSKIKSLKKFSELNISLIKLKFVYKIISYLRWEENRDSSIVFSFSNPLIRIDESITDFLQDIFIDIFGKRAEIYTDNGLKYYFQIDFEDEFNEEKLAEVDNNVDELDEIVEEDLEDTETVEINDTENV